MLILGSGISLAKLPAEIAETLGDCEALALSLRLSWSRSSVDSSDSSNSGHSFGKSVPLPR